MHGFVFLFIARMGIPLPAFVDSPNPIVRYVGAMIKAFILRISVKEGINARSEMMSILREILPVGTPWNDDFASDIIFRGEKIDYRVWIQALNRALIVRMSDEPNSDIWLEYLRPFTSESRAFSYFTALDARFTLSLNERSI